MLPALPRNYFDVVFVDGDHLYAAVLTDTGSDSTDQRRGLLCGDDLERQIFEIDEVYARTQIESDYIRDPRPDRNITGRDAGGGELFGEVSQVAGCWAVRKLGTGWERVDMSAVHCSEERIPAHLIRRNYTANPDFQRWRQDRRKTVTVPVNPGTQAACEQSEPSRHSRTATSRKPRAADSARFSKLGHRSALDL